MLFFFVNINVHKNRFTTLQNGPANSKTQFPEPKTNKKQLQQPAHLPINLLYRGNSTPQQSANKLLNIHECCS